MHGQVDSKLCCDSFGPPDQQLVGKHTQNPWAVNKDIPTAKQAMCKWSRLLPQPDQHVRKAMQQDVHQQRIAANMYQHRGLPSILLYRPSPSKHNTNQRYMCCPPHTSSQGQGLQQQHPPLSGGKAQSHKSEQFFEIRLLVHTASTATTTCAKGHAVKCT